MRKRHVRDENEVAAELVKRATATRSTKGESLLGSPELRLKYAEAMRADAAKGRKEKRRR